MAVWLNFWRPSAATLHHGLSQVLASYVNNAPSLELIKGPCYSGRLLCAAHEQIPRSAPSVQQMWPSFAFDLHTVISRALGSSLWTMWQNMQFLVWHSCFNFKNTLCNCIVLQQHMYWKETLLVDFFFITAHIGDQIYAAVHKRMEAGEIKALLHHGWVRESLSKWRWSLESDCKVSAGLLLCPLVIDLSEVILSTWSLRQPWELGCVRLAMTSCQSKATYLCTQLSSLISEDGSLCTLRTSCQHVGIDLYVNTDNEIIKPHKL